MLNSKSFVNFYENKIRIRKLDKKVLENKNINFNNDIKNIIPQSNQNNGKKNEEEIVNIKNEPIKK
jgi:hypothetical protein